MVRFISIGSWEKRAKELFLFVVATAAAFVLVTTVVLTTTKKH